MGIIDQAKAHPYVAGGVVLAAIVVFIIFSGSSGQPAGATAASGSDNTMSDVMAQINGNIQLASIAAAAHGDEVAAGKYAADLQAQTTQSANALAAELGMAQITSSERMSIQHDTLAASVAISSQNNQTQQLQISTSAANENTRIMADALTHKQCSTSSSWFGLVKTKTC